MKAKQVRSALNVLYLPKINIFCNKGPIEGNNQMQVRKMMRSDSKGKQLNANIQEIH